jgi:hypothetical protein
MIYYGSLIDSGWLEVVNICCETAVLPLVKAASLVSNNIK